MATRQASLQQLPGVAAVVMAALETRPRSEERSRPRSCPRETPGSAPTQTTTWAGAAASRGKYQRVAASVISQCATFESTNLFNLETIPVVKSHTFCGQLNSHWTPVPQFTGNSFDVACVQCEHSHSQRKVPFVFARGVTSPHIQCGGPKSNLEWCNCTHFVDCVNFFSTHRLARPFRLMRSVNALAFVAN